MPPFEHSPAHPLSKVIPPGRLCPVFWVPRILASLFNARERKSPPTGTHIKKLRILSFATCKTIRPSDFAVAKVCTVQTHGGVCLVQEHGVPDPAGICTCIIRHNVLETLIPGRFIHVRISKQNGPLANESIPGQFPLAKDKTDRVTAHRREDESVALLFRRFVGEYATIGQVFIYMDVRVAEETNGLCRPKPHRGVRGRSHQFPAIPTRISVDRHDGGIQNIVKQVRISFNIFLAVSAQRELVDEVEDAFPDDSAVEINSNNKL
ncbi:hypothetical protein DFH07DRAFT_779113 [Mycena maculata]|uniref:Uncharacterized protein n=1 Tax=Mycena maculata TaxID=230809 RepID=A0AAD7I9K0_9AGAR|nr:hypothetical protein DFH07DRAFT_779113 [Mycena maculata]